MLAVSRALLPRPVLAPLDQPLWHRRRDYIEGLEFHLDHVTCDTRQREMAIFCPANPDGRRAPAN